MPQILLIDDDRIICKMLETSLSQQGYQVFTASSGEEGLLVIKEIKPDIVVTDKNMPGIDGFEVTRRLRLNPAFANIPIIVLTGESELEDKLKAFEAGADDYLSKPFEKKELEARIAALLRRSEALKAAQNKVQESTELAQTIAIHSLRGGIGCSSIAVNFAIGLQTLWAEDTILIDADLNAGQIALMLNKPLRQTWANLVDKDIEELDYATAAKIITKHDSNLSLIAASSDPIMAERIPAGVIKHTMRLLQPQYQYMVVDLPHNFNNTSLEALDLADLIFLVIAPDIASIRTAANALNIYTELGYGPEKVRLILNNTFEIDGIPRKKIEAALQHRVAMEIPYYPKQFIGGINHGYPIVHARPDDAASEIFYELAYRSSKEQHKKEPPENPSPAWHQINNRLNLFSKRDLLNRTRSRTRQLFTS